MKKSRKSLMLLPLLAICLSGCYEIIPEDTPEVNEEEFTPEGSYTLPEESPDFEPDTPTTPDEPATPDEPDNPNTPDDPNDNPDTPDNPDNPDNPDEPEQETITYSLSILNKSSLESLTIDHNQEENTYTYKLEFAAYSISSINGTEEAAFNESDIEVTSSDTSIATADGSYLTLTGVAGYTYIHATWLGHLDEHEDNADDYFRMTVSIIDKVSYEYTFEIVNKSDLVGTDSIWYTDDSPRTIQVALYEQEVVNGEYNGEPILKETSDVSFSQVDPISEQEVNVVCFDGYNVSPATPGAVKIIATWDDGLNCPLTDSFEVEVLESYYEADFTLTINNKDNFTSENEDDLWRVGETKTLSVSLNSNTRAYSSNEIYKANDTISGNIYNLGIYVYNDSGDCVTGQDKTNDIAYYSVDEQTGVITLSPQAVAANKSYTIIVTWSEHETEAWDYLQVDIGAHVSEAFELVINSDTDSFKNWYKDDGDTKSIVFSVEDVFYYDDGSRESSSAIAIDEIASELIVYSTNPEAVSVSIQENGSVLAKANGTGSGVIYIVWSTHSEAVGFVEFSVNEHSYELSIDSNEGLGSQDDPWRIEQGSRDIILSFIKDGLKVTNPEYVVVKEANDTNLVTIAGPDTYDTYSIEPLAAGTTSLVATWYKDEGYETICASASILIYISDEQLPNYITLSNETLEFTDIESGQSLTATVYGKDGTTSNVKQDVTWSVIDGEGNIELSSTTDNTITVTAKAYSVTAKIEVVSNYDVTVKAECNVTVGDAPIHITPVDSINLTYAASNVSSPDDNGVYVLGTTNGTTYIKYDSGFTSTDSYDGASAVRTIATGSGTYYLEINEQYITSSLTLDSNITNAAEFSVDANGIKLDSSYVYIGANGGLNTTSGEQAYLLDMSLHEETISVTSGTFKLYAQNNGVAYFATSTLSSSRFTSTTDYSQAADFTIEPITDNEYYLSYMNGSTKTYIYTQSDGTGLGTSTSASYSVCFDSNGNWTTSGSSRSLLFNYNSGTPYFGNYTPGGSYQSVKLCTPNLVKPALKGLSIATTITTREEGETLTPTVSFYPSCVAYSYSISNVSFSQSGGSGSVSIENDGSGLITAISEGDVSIVGSCSGLSSNAISFEITKKEETEIVYKESEGFTSSDLGLSNEQTISSYSFDLSTLDFAKASGSNTPAYYDSGTAIRLYSKNTMTITPTHTDIALISSIEMTCVSKYFGGSDTTVTNASFTTSTTSFKITNVVDGTQPIVVTIGSTKNSSSETQLRFSKITIYYTQPS